jgi:hypothetical protein
MRLRVALVAAIALSDCLDPTEIVVVVSTDVSCSQVNSTAIAVGAPGDDTNRISGKTPACSSDGGIGTLVVTPSHGIGDDVGIRVTLGVGLVQADQCVAPKFEGCIVARRSLSFYPHHPLTLPITMQQICENQFCDPTSTCVNGTCVDAGIPCDETGTCAIDAGVPDAGSCDIKPKLVVPLTAQVQVTPHLVQTTTGYAIGYETATINDPSRVYEVIELDANGNPGNTVPMVSTLATGTPIGPLGTDGTNFAATFEPAPLALGIREIDPNGGNLHETAGAVVQLARAGMFYNAPGGGTPQFDFFLIGSTSSPTFESWSLANTLSGIAVNATGVNDPALAYFNGTYYGSYHDKSSCFIAPYASGTVGAIVTYPQCTTARVAENALGTDLVVTREMTSTAFGLVARPSFSSWSTTVTIDAVVDDQAIVALAGVGNEFHVVYGLAPDIFETTIDTSLAFTPPNKIAKATGFTLQASQGIGFDAIAEPGTMVHDVAFWASTPAPGIYFTRICN